MNAMLYALTRKTDPVRSPRGGPNATETAAAYRKRPSLKPAVRVLAQTYWNAFSDLKWRTVGQTASDDTIVTEEILDGTHDGALVLPDGSMPASGRHLSTRVCEIARVRGEEIVSLRLY